MKKALLAVSHGAASADAVEKCIVPLERAVSSAFPDRDCFRVFTGLIGRCEPDIMDPVKAYAILVEEKYEDVLICPLLLLSGREYSKTVKCFDGFPGRIRISDPLMSCPRALAEAIASILPPPSDDAAVVLVGHGNPELPGCYAALEKEFHTLGRGDVLIGVLRGSPGAEEISLGIRGVKRVLLSPLMLTAGIHAQRDIFGASETSWQSVFARAGFDVECCCGGLGEIKAIGQLFAENALKCED